ncbi:MAG: 30S ribosomal protein S12 methylthiotransferase RimO [Betaproteobacteria bacterium]|jgi:ribosomal protein S12 methylthiotransferase|nr:30S ribosomal protein S12 methylthiotransferase RimO [Pseudomonadota bacterium]NBO03020.1 30S ribosomal protein S12 methylthiotransferase RimO [Betaproteobacteria bacterium]NBO95285.1 30S ribosomal protein S12 methylthiotransferase RimO [Betaproteobacteria bacterium]NBP34133.1 30S ribosomal protein S12 methylthiotransferase RimO [Betaproteobacteria bacterium]NBP38221.1 30S ribosomal protein S12 methylthiotransferase RimO [Betaproteobacteria bacterium]
MKKDPAVGFVSLGCPKALVDSEQIITKLRAEGYRIAPDYQGADLVVVNTCGFIDAAVQESLDSIGEAIREQGKVIVTGCLGQRSNEHGENLIQSLHPKVLAVTGPHASDEVMAHVHRFLPKPHDPYIDLVPEAGIKLTPSHYAYLKISEGCNHRCSFCIIPSMRGDLVSRPIGEVVREAEALARSGVKEILVISQDTSAYGVDIKYRTGFVHGRPVRTRLTELVKELANLGIWVRLHYVYPYPHVDELFALMAQGLVLPYLDVPFQHANRRILKLMKRPAGGEDVLRRIEAWRAACPDLTLRSTFIAGFPSESETEFQELLDFLTAAKIDRAGCFAYSPVEGASANQLNGALPEHIREERRDRLMAHQAAISQERLKRWKGRRLQVLIDTIEQSEDGQLLGAIGRSAADAPEIDGVVYLRPHSSLAVGQFVTASISRSDHYDLYGSVVRSSH